MGDKSVWWVLSGSGSGSGRTGVVWSEPGVALLTTDAGPEESRA